MGVFTEQVQGLVSEARTQRKEQEERKKQRIKAERIKKEQQEAKKQLYYILSSYFTDAKINEYKKIYIKLLDNKLKWQIIGEITTKEDLEYYLDINYINILNKIKSSYISIYNEYKKEEKEEEIKENEPTTFDIILSIIKCILFIIFIPILFFVMLFYYLLK